MRFDYSYLYKDSARFHCSSGSPFVDIYHPIVDKETGHFELELDINQRKNLYDEIQSHKDSVDIHKIVDRYRAGDTSVLQRAQGMYGDLTEFPKDFFAYKELELKAEQTFDALPVEIKQKFDNSYLTFCLSAGSDDWFDKLNIEKPVVQTSEKGSDE